MERVEKPPLRRVYILPNLFTAFNMFLGLLALYSFHLGYIEKACWLVIFAGLLDGLDGAVARLTRTQSSFGSQFDSLADVVSFGVVPSLAAFSLMAHMGGPNTRFLTGVCALYAVCGALRLARYNVQAKSSEKRGFTGLPIPGAAGGVVTLVLLIHQYNLDKSTANVLPFGGGLEVQTLVAATFPFVLIALALLMVSEVPYPNMMRKIRLQRSMSFDTLVSVVLLSVPIVSIGSKDRVALFFILAYSFILFAPARTLCRVLLNHSRREAAPTKKPARNS